MSRSNLANYDKVSTRIRRVYIEKNANYGDSFSASIDEWGLIAGVVRIDDKMRRLKQLVKTKSEGTQDESIRDTLEDMANYCIMLAACMDDGKLEQLEAIK